MGIGVASVSKCRQAQEILDTLDEGAYREVMQARRVKIATPYPSISRVASEAGVSKKRLGELKRLVESIVKNRDARRRSAKRPRSRR